MGAFGQSDPSTNLTVCRWRRPLKIRVMTVLRFGTFFRCGLLNSGSLIYKCIFILLQRRRFVYKNIGVFFAWPILQVFERFFFFKGAHLGKNTINRIHRAHYRRRCFHTWWNTKCNQANVLQAVVSRGCVLSAAALESSQDTKHSVIPLVIGL